MARYIADQNKVVMLHESGTYATVSGNGVWLGEITEHTIDDAENKIEDRYMGTLTRNYGDFELGPRDVTGTITYNVQDFRLPFYAIGSITDTAGVTMDVTATEIDTDEVQSTYTSGPLNPPRSFTLEDSKQAAGTGKNFIRTVNGCVLNTVTITATQGEKVNVAVDYIGQTLASSSGATTALTEDTTRPYLWSSASLTLGTSSIDSAKEVTLEINNNLEAPHYLNGSRDISVPFPLNREYTLNTTLDLDSDVAQTLYETYYKDNTEFNGILDFNQDGTGSQHTIFTMSGCKITSMENPSTMEGVTESTIEVRPQTISAIEYKTSGAAAGFNPW